MINNRLIIIGASGHGKVIADIAVLRGYRDIVFLDDDETRVSCGGFPIVGKIIEADSIEGEIFVAIGNPEIRKELTEKYAERVFPVLIHPNATVAKSASIGVGTVLMAGSVVNPEASIGKGSIINTCASVDHDCVLGSYVHVSVGAHVAGSVRIGNNSWIGAGATISNNVSICDDCIVGAGAVVVNNIVVPGKYVGVPAKQLME